MVGYTKLFSDIVMSTIWREPDHVRIVWVTMLAVADKDSRVHASIPGLADAARVTVEQCEDALRVLLDPDPYSRSKEYEGRRIAAVDGGWDLLNGPKYRQRMTTEERKAYKAKKAREYRQREKEDQDRRGQAWTVVDKCGQAGTDRTSARTKSRKAEAEAEAEAEEERKKTSIAAQSPPFEANGKTELFPSDGDKIEKKECLQEVLEYWNRNRTPKVIKLTAKRRAALTARLKDRDWPWRAAIDSLPIPGKFGQEWQPDFDWLIRNDSNAYRLAEGAYKVDTKDDYGF